MTRLRLWFPVLLVCALCALPATTLLAGTGLSAAAVAATPQPLQVALTPCDAPGPSLPCRSDPVQVQADIPDSSSDVAGIQVDWVTWSQSAPAPSSTQVVLTEATGPNGPASCAPGTPAAPSGTTATCWDWPAALRYKSSSWILNGTYQVLPCADVSSGSGPGAACTKYSTSVSASRAEVAVPPASPARVAAAQSNGSVTVTWNPGPEPDLVGYAVSRNNQPVYTCSTDGAGPGAGTPCANPPSFHDQPGSGAWSYAVTALRFGADGSASHVVASSPAPASVSVPAPTATSGGGAASTGGSAGRAAVPALPPVGVMRPAELNAGGTAAAGAPSLAGSEDSGGAAGGTPGALPYQENPSPNGALASGTLVRPQKPESNLDAVAELALAVIALALAVHVWYLRGELRVASVRVAARRAAREAAG